MLARRIQDYWGHIFWDQDMWMYPGILMFHPDLARIILLTRERTYDVAKGNAKRSGDRGIRFPWESAATGNFIDV
jgi:trehalose/maltose hydrolase-like predicted phosphorylase